MKKIILTLIATIFFIPFTISQWVQTSCPDEQRVVCFAVSGSNIFAGSSGTGGGIQLSTDEGLSWTEVFEGSVWALTASGSNIFAGTYEDGVFFSNDNGASWTEVNNGLTYLFIRSLIANGTDVFAGTHLGGVFKSTNNGANWIAVNSGIPINTIVLAFAISGTNIFLGTGSSGVYKSINNGSNWTSVNTGLPANSTILSLVVNGTEIFAGTHYDGVFLSSNSGGSWVSASTGLVTYNEKCIFSLAVSEFNIFAGTRGGVFLSSDNGTSWIDVNYGLPDSVTEALVVSGSYLFAGIDSLDNTGGYHSKGVWKRSLSDILTGVEENIDNDIIIYPNPVINSLTFRANKISIFEIYNIHGQLIKIIEPVVNETNVDISELNSGIYIVKIINANGSMAKKIIKE